MARLFPAAGRSVGVPVRRAVRPLPLARPHDPERAGGSAAAGGTGFSEGSSYGRTLTTARVAVKPASLCEPSQWGLFFE